MSDNQIEPTINRYEMVVYDLVTKLQLETDTQDGIAIANVVRRARGVLTVAQTHDAIRSLVASGALLQRGMRVYA